MQLCTFANSFYTANHKDLICKPLFLSSVFSSFLPPCFFFTSLSFALLKLHQTALLLAHVVITLDLLLPLLDYCYIYLNIHHLNNPLLVFIPLLSPRCPVMSNMHPCICVICNLAARVFFTPVVLFWNTFWLRLQRWHSSNRFRRVIPSPGPKANICIPEWFFQFWEQLHSLIFTQSLVNLKTICLLSSLGNRFCCSSSDWNNMEPGAEINKSV